MSRRIVICDPGLFSTGSHNYNCGLALSSELRRRGHNVTFYGYRYADPAVLSATGAIPHFEQLLWNRVDTERPFDEELNWRVLNNAFQSDLERLGDAITGSDRVVLIPNILQHQIAGFARWYRGLPDAARPAVLINLMFFPRWTAWSDQAVRGAEYYLRAVDEIRPWIGGKIGLCAENSDIARFYRELLDADIMITPVPVEPPARLTNKPEPRPVRLGYVGYAKNEKGFYLLPEALEIAFRKRRDFRALVQIHHHSAEPETVAADRALSRMRNIDIVRGNVEKAFYYAMLDIADILLLPYDPVHYNARGSGVLSEAVAYAKPVIATTKTWAGNAIHRGECAGVACEFDSHSLAGAILEAVGNLHALQNKAASKAAEWLGSNSVEVYCDVVERHGLESPPPFTSRRLAEGPSLAGAFPNWPHAVAAPLPQPIAPVEGVTAGIAWQETGVAVIQTGRAYASFIMPAGANANAIELRAFAVDASSGPNEAEVTLNGHSLGVIAYSDQPQVCTLPLQHELSAGLPAMLQVKLRDGAAPLALSGVRISLKRRVRRDQKLGRLFAKTA